MYTYVSCLWASPVCIKEVYSTEEQNVFRTSEEFMMFCVLIDIFVRVRSHLSKITGEIFPSFTKSDVTVIRSVISLFELFVEFYFIYQINGRIKLYSISNLSTTLV